MIVDTSAIIAILFNEAERETYTYEILRAKSPMMSAASFLEAGIVADGRESDTSDVLNDVINELGLSIEPVTREHANLARDAYRRFGKGNHPAKLNFGDCFAYALAKATGEPLLFKGDDFTQTDLDTVPV